jgi:hypothetical protein
MAWAKSELRPCGIAFVPGSARGHPTVHIELQWNYRPDRDRYMIYTTAQQFASLAGVSPAQGPAVHTVNNWRI